MTPKEKAEELVNDILDLLYDNGSLSFKTILYSKAKQCALRCVSEILKDREEIDGMRVINDPYWLEVKKEIELL